MQPDHQDTAPLPDQSSPTFASLRRHHQPTQPAEPYRDTSPSASSSTLRRRAIIRDGDVLRIDIRTPFENGASGTKEGYPVHRSTTVREFKDGIAEGQYGEGSIWIRDGMRIVWQGRIIRDEEVIGDVVANSRSGDIVHTLHLVARRLGGTPAIPRVGSGYFNQTLPIPEPTAIPIPAAQEVESSTSRRTPLAPEAQALLDTIHYLLFTARYHLFRLIGRGPLRWNDTVPPPVVNQAVAREAVMSVIRTVVDAQAEDDRVVWAEWERAFDGDDEEAVKRVLGEVSREGMEREIQAIWRNRVGREWEDSDKGQIVDVEIDQTVFQLNLPRLNSLTSIEVLHLRTYLKITSLLPQLYPFLPQPPPTPTTHLQPTPTTTAPPTRPTFRSSLTTIISSIPRIPLPVLSHMFFSAFKLIAMLWMMTQGMPWSDSRLWIIGGAATGWWLADGYQRYIQDRPRAPAPPTPNPAHAQGENVPGAVPDQGNQNVLAGTQALAIPNPPRAALAPHLAIPLVHLSTDTTQLRLITDTLNPTRQLEIARTPSQPQSRPSKIITQFLLPISLWFITLIPEFEAIRTRAIKRRERAMRVLVGELNTSPPGVGHVQEGGGEDAEVQAEQNVELVLPEGLNEVARKYYLRTMERGEGIDWEEEREAQRAMGIGREEEDAGAGGLLGLF